MRDRDVRKSLWRLRTGVEVRRQRDLILIIEIEEFFGRCRRTVRLIETNCQKERFVLVTREVFDRAVGNLVIAKRLSVTVEHYDSIRCRSARGTIGLWGAFRIVGLASTL